MARVQDQAAVFDGYGAVGRVRLIPLERRPPAAGELQVRVVASGVSHMDAYVREGRFQDVIAPEFPSRQGTSFAGIVTAVGSEVKDYRVGAEVLGHDPAHGAHASFLTVPASAVVRKPPRLPWEVAGALYLVGLTAFTLVQSLRLAAGDVVLISAAAGGVGHIECQLARLAGARVIGIAGTDNHDYLRSLGVKPVGYGEDMAATVREAAAGSKVTALLDNYGRYEELAAALEIPAARIAGTGTRRETEVRLYRAEAESGLALQLADIAELVSEWNIRVLVSGFYPFTAIDRALDDLDRRHSRGVIVVGMQTAAPAGEYLRGKLRAVHERPTSP